MRILILCSVLFANILPSFCENDQITYRLDNKYISVYSYDLFLLPNLENDFNFNGVVKIRFYTISAMDCFSLNSKNLEITEVKVYSTRITYTSTHELIPEKEMLKICVQPRLAYYYFVTVEIAFKGTLNDEPKGLYKIGYEENGTKKWLMATMFTPTYARMAFPCFDEPEYRGRFTISVARKDNQVVHTVSELESTTPASPAIGNRLQDNFKITDPVSTYMIEIVLHEFKSITGIPPVLNIHSRQHTKEDTAFYVSEVYSWYKELVKYLDIEQSSRKVNLVCAPDADEFSRVAGLILYKEKDIFQINGIDTDKRRQEIARVAIHKITHIWLGAYVTPYWWDNTWLIEAYAKLLEYRITSLIYPDWGMDHLFQVEVVQSSLSKDLDSNLVLTAKTGHPKDIQSQKYNTDINDKGAAILSTLENLVGKEVMKTSLSNCLKKSKRDDGVLTAKKCWEEYQNQVYNKNILPTGETVESIMNTWMDNPGYPLVNVFRKPDGSVEIKQEALHSPLSIEAASARKWKIPVTCTKQSSPVFTNNKPTTWLLDERLVTLQITLKDGEWIICNTQIGYYRVNYNKDWELIIDQLKKEHGKIDVKNRAQLIDDALHLAFLKKLSFSTSIQASTYLEKEEDIIPWLSFSSHIDTFSKVFQETSANEYLMSYFKGLFEKIYNRINFNSQKDESYSVKTNRPTILKVACRVGVEACNTQAAKLYNENINDLTKVPAQAKYVVYCNSFKLFENKETAWGKLWTMYKNSKVMSEKELLLKSLACANDDVLFKRYLKMIIQPSDVAFYIHEKELIIKSVCQTNQGITATLDIISEMMPQISTQSEETIRTLISMVNQIKPNIYSEKHLEKIKQIVTNMEAAEKKNEALLSAIKVTQTQATKNVEYKNQNVEEIKQAIHAITGYTPPPPTTTPVITTKPATTTAAVTTAKPATQSPDASKAPTYTTDIPSPPSGGNYLLPSIVLPFTLFIGLFVKYIVI